MTRSIVVGGAPNLTPYATITAVGPTPATMPPSNLATDEPTERSRITTLDQLKTAWKFLYPNGSTYANTIGVNPKIPWYPIPYPIHTLLGAVNHNFQRGIAQYRYLQDSTGAFPFTRIAPTSIIASTNITGVITDIDEDPYTPDGAYATANADSITKIRVGFPSTGATLRSGSKMQVFRAALRLSSHNLNPTLVTVNLWRNSVLVASNLDGGIWLTNTNNAIMVAYWDTTLFGSTSDANVQMELVSSDSFDIDAMDWLKETTANTYLDDSGWLTVPSPDDSALWGSANNVVPSVIQPPTPNKNLFYLPATPQGAEYVQLIVRDPYNPDGFVQYGVQVDSNAYSGSIKKDSFYLRVISEARGGVTIGGQTYSRDAWRRRAFGFDLLATRAEILSIMDRLDFAKGAAGAVAILLEPDDIPDASYQEFNFLWATIVAGSGGSSGSAVGGDATPMAHDPGSLGQSAKQFTKHYDCEEKT